MNSNIKKYNSFSDLKSDSKVNKSLVPKSLIESQLASFFISLKENQATATKNIKSKRANTSR